MPLIQWRDDLKVGVKEFDFHHKNLIALTNKLNEAVMEKKGSKLIGEVLAEISKYTIYHFFAEEELMDKYGYPEAARHREEHLKLTETTLQLMDEFSNNVPGVEHKALAFLITWINHHISETDKRYTSFFNSKGIV